MDTPEVKNATCIGYWNRQDLAHTSQKIELISSAQRDERERWKGGTLQYRTICRLNSQRRLIFASFSPQPDTAFDVDD
jgi:hypothetical protein